MDISLRGKRAVVCGSSQGIGFAIAKELATCGATCILLARNEAALTKAVAELATSQGQQHSWAVADFSKTEEVRTAIANIVGKQTIHILVNNTGGPAAGRIVQAREDEFILAFQQHLVNNHLLVKAVLPGMMQENYGRIINIISTSVKVPLKNLGVSNTIRGAVASWAKSIANEIGAYNITINNILPGLTTTQRLDSLIRHTAAQQKKDETAVEIEMMEEVPLKRFGSPEEIAAVAAFLATPAASYVNGTSIPVDGGRTGAL